MSSPAVTTRTLYPSSYSQDPTSSSTSSVRVPTTITHLVTKTLASDISSSVPLNDFGAGSRTTSGTTLGLAIGLPVGLFCLGLLIFLFYFYWKDTSFDLKTPNIEVGGTYKQPSEKGWLSNILYGSENVDDNDSYLNVKRLPSMSSRIQYKISKPVPHILTPKAPICKEPAHSVEFSDDVDALLYTRPPNIYHIDSKMPSTNSLGGQQSLPSVQVGTSFDKPTRKWNYQSPLSRWFLRSSTYLQDGFALSGTVKTPTVQLKQLKILSRIHKDYADSSQFLFDEKSPILGSTGGSSDSQESVEPSGMINDDKVLTPSSAVFCTIDPQIFEVGDESWPNVRPIELNPVPSNLSKAGQKRKGRRDSRLRKHLKQISDVKPLPNVPKSRDESDNRLRVGYVYKVVQDYNARLADEIHIKLGEYAKVLATHTDGWCLVEKCTAEDQRGSQSVQGKSADGKGYLNDDRGIIPGDCLE